MSSQTETVWQRRVRRERQYREYVEATGGGCEVCGAKAGERGICGTVNKRNLDDDHDHKTGVHRGWICARSNKHLHYWMTVEWYRAMALYLESRAC